MPFQEKINKVDKFNIPRLKISDSNLKFSEVRNREVVTAIQSNRESVPPFIDHKMGDCCDKTLIKSDPNMKTVHDVSPLFTIPTLNTTN